MKAIQRFYLVFAAALSALWWLADSSWVGSGNYFAWRSAFTNLTGELGIAVMSVAMVLAVRPRRAEPGLGGLDKMYRLHKWLGITGLVLAIVHWALAKSPRYLIDLGWVTRPVRPPRAPESNPVFQFFREQRHLAETIGEYAFYAVVVLLALALIKRFPYKAFFRTHRWIAVVYLALVLHSVLLMPFGWWSGALGPLMTLLMAAGSVAAVVSLRRRVGIDRQVQAEVDAVEFHEAAQVLQVDLRLQGPWAGHQAGQFAFVGFDPAEGPHPYTIASAWQGDGRLRFVIKALGDHTRALQRSLKVGTRCTVEGPYGRFVFDGAARRQIWVAGGIGITPFLARMAACASATGTDAPAVDLFWSVRSLEDTVRARVQASAERARVRLHLIVDDGAGRLDADRITAAVPDWQGADVWFCGPAGFGRALRRAFGRLGLGSGRFHQELFQMR
ncbi:putative ferric reductase [Sphaerotilus hippei]|uniref:Putative ferric reductase n=1 Tax=Sphaerotilus hippei TaxID=744406 RepID=A0A318GZS5_9BURK|nr:ferric reductase-like transmembrane domain-containing protein [Sphaerotilus hippei]PXW94326.1 putative ferric reductase [Sphaerotilus hippei]